MFSLLRYEIKAAKDQERYNRDVEKAMGQTAHRSAKEAEKKKSKLKTSPSNQQKLSKMFNVQIEKKCKPELPVKIVTVPFSLSSCKCQVQRQEKNYSDEHELFLIRRQSFPDVWMLATEKKLMLLNPYRLEEALLCKRLLMNHKLPVEKLDTPIVLTDRYSTIEQEVLMAKSVIIYIFVNMNFDHLSISFPRGTFSAPYFHNFALANFPPLIM